MAPALESQPSVEAKQTSGLAPAEPTKDEESTGYSDDSFDVDEMLLSEGDFKAIEQAELDSHVQRTTANDATPAMDVTAPRDSAPQSAPGASSDAGNPDTLLLPGEDVKDRRVSFSSPIASHLVFEANDAAGDANAASIIPPPITKSQPPPASPTSTRSIGGR